MITEKLYVVLSAYRKLMDWQCGSCRFTKICYNENKIEERKVVG